jgi:hypothetical protein
MSARSSGAGTFRRSVLVFQQPTLQFRILSKIRVQRMRLGREVCPIARAKGSDFVKCTARQRSDVCFFFEKVQLISCCLF